MSSLAQVVLPTYDLSESSPRFSWQQSNGTWDVWKELIVVYCSSGFVTVLFASNLWPWCLPQAYCNFCMVFLGHTELSEVKYPILFLCNSNKILTLSLFRLQFIQLLKSSSGAFGVYPTIKHLLPSSTFLTFWMPRLRAKKLLILMWSTYGKPTGMPTGYVQGCMCSLKMQLQRWNVSCVIKRIRFWYVWE